MSGRYVLIPLALISLLWIAYVSIDLVAKKDKYTPTHLFGEQDGALLVLNRINETSAEQLQFKLPKEVNSLFTQLLPGLENPKLIILSAKQNHLYIEHKEIWGKTNVTELFNKVGLPIHFSSIKSFESIGFTGRIRGNVLYLSKQVKIPQIEQGWYKVDFHASAAIVRFSNGSHSITDIYVKPNNTIEYIMTTVRELIGATVNDQNLFAQAIPASAESYHFYERDYYSRLDETYAKGPLFKWAANGFVHFEYQGMPVIISDYIPGQDPELLLNELVNTQKSGQKTEAGEFQNILLTDPILFNGASGFYLRTMDDYVVMAPSLQICDQIVADYKLGNTLSTQQDKLTVLFGKLPRKVSERKATSNLVSAKRVYKNKLFETRYTFQPLLSKPKQAVSNNTSLYVGDEIVDFKTYPGKGNVVVVTKSGKIICFESGKRVWENTFEGSLNGHIELIDLYDKEKSYVLLTSPKQIQLINLNGKPHVGFPINLNSNATNQAVHYKWKGNHYFLVANEKNELIQFNSKGKIGMTVPSGLSTILNPIEVWVSQRQLFAGAKDNTTFSMFNMKKGKEYRSYPIANGSKSFDFNNEIFHYSLVNNGLVKTDQKGRITKIANYSNPFFMELKRKASVPSLIIKDGQKIHFLSLRGDVIHTLETPYKQLADAAIYRFPNGIIYTAVLDDLENNVYLYSGNGQLLFNKPLEGERKLQLSTENKSELIITTIVEDYIIQYIENIQ
jgi:hypothetical protein